MTPIEEYDYEIERSRAFVKIVAGLSDMLRGAADWLCTYTDEEAARIEAEGRRRASPEPTERRERPRGRRRGVGAP